MTLLSSRCDSNRACGCDSSDQAAAAWAFTPECVTRLRLVFHPQPGYEDATLIPNSCARLFT